MAIFGVDVDGVIGALDEAVNEYINEKHGLNLRPEDVTHWDFWTQYLGDVPTMLSIMDDLWIDGAVKLIEPNTGELLHAVRDAGHRIVINTSRTHPSHPAMIDHLIKWGIPYDDMLLCGYGGNKFVLKMDYLIDDNPKCVSEICHHPNTQLFLRHQPWNAQVPTDGVANAQRVFSLAEAVEIILKKNV